MTTARLLSLGDEVTRVELNSVRVIKQIASQVWASGHEDIFCPRGIRPPCENLLQVFFLAFDGRWWSPGLTPSIVRRVDWKQIKEINSQNSTRRECGLLIRIYRSVSKAALLLDSCQLICRLLVATAAALFTETGKAEVE